MDKSLIHHSFYIRLPYNKSFTIKLFIYDISSRGYEVYDPSNPEGYRIFTLKADYKKYVDEVKGIDGAVKIVKHSKKTIEKKLKELKLEMQRRLI